MGLSWLARKSGELEAKWARYGLLFPITENEGKILWFRCKAGVRDFLGDEEMQKKLLPFRFVHAKELRKSIPTRAYSNDFCCDEFPEEARAEIFEARANKDGEEE